jgi:hypothetical protein
MSLAKRVAPELLSPVLHSTHVIDHRRSNSVNGIARRSGFLCGCWDRNEAIPCSNPHEYLRHDPGGHGRPELATILFDLGPLAEVKPEWSLVRDAVALVYGGGWARPRPRPDECSCHHRMATCAARHRLLIERPQSPCSSVAAFARGARRTPSLLTSRSSRAA